MWLKVTTGVVWRVTHDEQGAIVVDVAEVWAIGARSDASVYAEMTERARSLPSGPSTLALAEVIERLGRTGSGLSARDEPSSTSELPGWLVDRLVEQAGLPAESVVELTLEQAFDAWTGWANRDRGGGSGPEKSPELRPDLSSEEACCPHRCPHSHWGQARGDAPFLIDPCHQGGLGRRFRPPRRAAE